VLDVTRADEAKRLVAGAVDLGIAWLFFALLALIAGSFPACLIVACLLLLRDSPTFERWGIASPGKRLVGLTVVGHRDRPLDHVASIERNLTTASFFLITPVMVTLFALLPFIDGAAGYLAGALLSILLLGIEVYEIVRDPRGQRLGDLLAGTMVIETAFQGLDANHWQAPENEI